MLSLEEARSLIAEKIQPLNPVRLPLSGARGRVLAEAVRAPEDIPAFDRSAMDGYAIGAADSSGRFRVVGEIQPGTGETPAIREGECARIFTGATVPAGAARVVMQEDTRREGDFMILTQSSHEAHIRRRGEDARAGDELLGAGTVLGPGELSLLAQLGVIEPRVSPAVRVLHCATGNELVAPDQQPAPGQIRDTNSTLVAALLADRGATLVHQQRCGDSLDLLSTAIGAMAVDSWDLLLISGGASVGDYDFGARALDRSGFEIHFRKINLRPGRPLICATRGPQAAFVIPGNPAAHFVTFHTAIARAIECFERAPEAWPILSVALGAALSDAPNPRETWWPARVSAKAGALGARPLAWKSSGDLCGLAPANGLIRVPPNAGPLAAGAEADCLLLDHWTRGRVVAS